MKTQFEELMSELDDIESFLSGEKEGFKVHVPKKVDVKSIRNKLRMTEARFSDVLGFSLDAIKHWEGGRRTPEAPARTLPRDRQESRRSPHRASAGGLRFGRRIFQGPYCSVQDHKEDSQERSLCCKSFSAWRSLRSAVHITMPVDILR
jgi:putative transcriptional regulator